ncbi:thermonuclease family protein [Desulfuromonas sp. TF]|uniref:thermonuclease family protein n=1 Tax=Desulfuromonas sp. TF TaxID=1232410 RepID=UPI001D0578E5|nr:thermonuclease family protein [Desulfuromonas sp. TF]
MIESIRFILTSVALVVYASHCFAASFQGMLVKITDGDTVEVLHNGRAERIRLHGIDTPEKGQAYGNKAKHFVLDIAAQKIVTVEVKDTDRYGRTVGEVILPDGRSLNRELVREGYAWWYRKYSNDASLGVLEAEARAAGKGLWRDKNPVPPWVWRAAKRNGGRADPQSITLSASSSAKQATSANVYHGNTSSHVFHQSTCKHYNCKNCIKVFSSRAEAISQGYKPCGICKP